MSAQARISSPMVSHPPSFNVHLDPAAMDFLKQKLCDSHERQNNILLEAGHPNPYVTVVEVLEQALHEATAAALSKPLRPQPQTDRERG